jgi:outer membrane protein insertion porin family
MRLGVLLLAVLVGCLPIALVNRAWADDRPAQDLTPIAPVPAVEPAATVPRLDPPPDLSGLTGKPIARVVVTLEANIWDDVRVPAITSVKPGEILTPALARRALDELLRSGRFARGRVSAEAEGQGVALVAQVVPRKIIARLSMDLHGMSVDRDELLRQTNLVEGGEIVAADIDVTQKRIEAQCALHGYPNARAAITTHEGSDPTHARVMLEVLPGVPRSIDQRLFYASGSNADRVLAIAKSYAVDVHARADEPVLDQADIALEQTLRGRGWFKAGVSHDLAKVVSGPRTGAIVLRVRIDSGPLFVARFEGNEHYDADVLTTVLGIETETDRSPTHLVDRIRAFYQKRGFFDAVVRVQIRGGESDAVVLLVFRIDEYDRVRVAGRSYPCLRTDAIRKLNAGGPRSPGDIGTEIDSYLDEELPGADLFVDPDPRVVSATIGGGSGQVTGAPRPVPIDLRPDATYVADTYDRAIEHVQALYRNEGFLHAEVGPVGVVRARCDPRSPPERCVPMPMPPIPTEVCTYDSTGLPAPSEPLDPALTCRPDPAHGVACAPVVQLLIPIKLGPRTRLWDLAFTGVKAASERALAEAADLRLGDAASTTKIEDARRRVVDWYKEHGYYYADVKYAFDLSADNTRARARFDVTEGEQVIVRSIVVRGLQNTKESVVRRRFALEVGQPYRQSDVRKTQEHVSTLGVFSSVTVALIDPYVPQRYKDVVVEVVERDSQYVEVRPGLSTGEGVRGVLEYGHRNLLGDAWSMTVHLQASYLPDFLILDEGVKANYRGLTTAQRIATRDTLTFSWPEVGLGPTIRAQVDGIYVNDLERDFTLRKAAVVGTLFWRPVREVLVSVGADYENNDVHLFDVCTPPAPATASTAAMASTTPTPPTGPCATISEYLMQNPGNSELATLLRVPDGDSNVVADRIVLTWDRRDNTFNAHRGTYVVVGIEQVNSYPAGSAPVTGDQQYESHFFRLTQTLAGYIPVTNGITFAAELRLGENVTPWCSERPGPGPPVHWECTYPDREFFMGGFESMRGWLQDSFIPQDYVDQISQHALSCTNNQTSCSVPERGGNLMFNPRAELRFPVRLPIEASLFGDLGNLWVDPTYVFNHPFTLRADVGAGVRVDTPVGPLVFDYGINVTRKSYEDFGAFHFAIGLF